MDITISFKISPKLIKDVLGQSTSSAEGTDKKVNPFKLIADPEVAKALFTLFKKGTGVLSESKESEDVESDNPIEDDVKDENVEEDDDPVTVNENYRHHAKFEPCGDGEVIVRRVKKTAKETAESAYFRRLISMADECDDEADIEVEQLIKSAFSAAIVDTESDESEREAFEACHKVCTPFFRWAYPTGFIKGKVLKESASYLESYLPVLSTFLE